MTRELARSEQSCLEQFDNNTAGFCDDLADSVLILAILCQSNAIEKGFWDKPRPKPEMIALIHSEVSEMFEAIRKPDLMSEKCPELTLEEEEWADILIRLLDYGRGHNLRVGEAFVQKMRYNRNREKMHGKLF